MPVAAPPLHNLPHGRDALPHRWVGGIAALNRVPIPARRQPAAARQDQAASAQIGQPVGHQQTERTQTTGDQIGRVGAAAQRFADRFTPLDGRYTVFGRVIAGMEVVDAIQQWDVIRRVRVWDGSSAN